MLQRKNNTKAFGDKGENYAVSLLKRNGYKILEKNFRTRFAELDIVAVDGDTLVFVEVKARRSKKHGLPEEAVDARKLWRIKKAADYYLLANKDKKLPKKHRIDVVAIQIDGDKVRNAKIIKVM